MTLRSRTLVAAGAVLALAGALVDPAELAAGPLRSSWFYTLPLLTQLRLALIVLGVSLALLPALLALLRRPDRGLAVQGPLTRGIDFAFAAALVLAGLALLVREDPLTKDTKYYLGESLDIAAHGGAPGLVPRCFDGSWTEANRQPIYLAAIAPFAEPSNRFLDAARLVSLCGAVATLLACLRACRRRGGESAALLGGALLVTNGAFLHTSVTVACESWWTAFAVLAVDDATREPAPGEQQRWARVGAWIALAFLTKGTGTLLLLATSAWILWRERRRAWRALWPLLAAFAIVASPLLVRNARLFGDPLWNVNSHRVFWLDSWEQFFDPRAMESASAPHYLATHSLVGIAGRAATGLAKEAVHLLESCAPWSPHAGLGAPLLVLLVACWTCLAERRLRSFLALLCGVWIASFAWYAQVASDVRFLAVLVPIALPVVGALARRLTDGERRGVRFAALLGIGALALVSLGRGALEFRPGRFEGSTWNAPLREFLRERTRATPDAIYLLGPSRRCGFDWDRSLSATRLPRPETDGELADLLAASRGDRVRFLVVEAPEPRRRVGDDWVRAGPKGGLAEAAPPDGWAAVARFPEADPRIVVFERR